MKKVLIVGASGATGKLLVAEFLKRNIRVIAIVRTASSLKHVFGKHSNYEEVSASIDELSDKDLSQSLKGCSAVLSCLGHNLTFRGVFGKPRRLVADTVEKVVRVIVSMQPENKIKVILMNTTGNSNRDIPENPPWSQRIVISVLRHILPPHVDNERAADVLRTRIGDDHQFIEWVAVRPDNLTDETEVSKYSIHPSPTRNVIFDAARTSRINVANFMADLVTESELWRTWKGRMPVIYNDA